MVTGPLPLTVQYSFIAHNCKTCACNLNNIINTINHTFMLAVLLKSLYIYYYKENITRTGNVVRFT